MRTSVVVAGLDPSLTKSGVVCGDKHIFIETTPLPKEGFFECLRRRSDEFSVQLVKFLQAQDNPLRHDLYLMCEGPMLNPGSSMHLFEISWLMEHMETELKKHCPRLKIFYIQPSSVKKFLGDGSAPKKHDKKCGEVKKLKKGDKVVKCVPCIIKEKYGVEFAKDRGSDKAHAFALAKIGEAMVAGTYKYVEIPRRGQGK